MLLDGMCATMQYRHLKPIIFQSDQAILTATLPATSVFGDGVFSYPIRARAYLDEEVLDPLLLDILQYREMPGD